MPEYTFYNTKTKKYIEKTMSIAAREQYLKDNPHIEQRITKAPARGDIVRLGLKKPDQGFREVLAKVKEAHPGGKLKQNRTHINTF